MEEEFTITEDEYVSANKLFTKPSSKHLALYVVAISILVVVLIFTPNFIVRAGAIGAIVGGVAVHVFGRFVHGPWQTRKQYKLYTAMQERMTVTITDDGVCFKSTQGDSKLDWGHIIKWREGKEQILLYQAPLVYHIIPKRIAESSALTKYLGVRVGKSS